jgi:glycosyltransferase involved in cell wall biosynthesis
MHASRRSYGVAVFHTPSVSLFAPHVRDAKKFVVSVDATPLQMDAMGSWYNHGTSSRALERAKTRLYRRTFQRAEALVSWSEWAAASLEADYGVPAAKITVAHPGASTPFFELPRTARGGRPRILFVGGDFARKGGPTLLQAFAPLAERADLTIVSGDTVPTLPGVTVERDVKPGTARLFDAYAAADIFCFPTRGDCTPLVLGEAMAAGLPVITTRVGSNEETLQRGRGGILVEPDNVRQLSEALTRLVDNPGERNSLGAAARSIARERLDARKNGGRIFDLLRRVAS